MQGNRMREVACRIRWARGAKKGKMVTEVVEVDCDLEPSFICGRAGCDQARSETEGGVFNAVYKNLANHFHLTCNSLFVRPMSIRRFGLLGETEDAKSLVEGSFNLEELIDPEEREILRAF